MQRHNYSPGLIYALLMAVLPPAAAHHSYSMFDRSKVVAYQGVVREFEFTNPHSLLWVYINDADGKPQLWGIEAAGPLQLGRGGMTKDSIKPGDKISIKINPLRDGRHGGNMVEITLASGEVINAGALPGASGGQAVLNNGPGS